MSLNELIKKLEVFSADERHEEVFDSSYEILKSTPQDTRALRLTVVSLIHLDRYQKAYKILKQYKSDKKDLLLLERLYVLYKLGLDNELSDEFSKLDNHQLNKGLLHLKAQHLYRMGDYERALEIYHVLIEKIEGQDELIDLSVNERAILADSEELDAFNKSSVVEESYDLIFNEALIELGFKNYPKSLELLSSAESKVFEIKDEQERLSELLPILLQRAYIYQILGDFEAAKSILSSIDLSKVPKNELNELIFKNNYISLFHPSSLQSQEAFITLKELSLPNSINDLKSRFSKIQKSKITNNYSKISLITGQNINSKDLTSLALKSLSNANVFLDQDNAKKHAKKSLKYALKTKEIAPALIATQLNVNVGNLDGSVEILENLDEENLLVPGISSLLLSLYESLNSEKKKLNLFNQIYQRYKDFNELSADEYEFLKIISFKFLESANEQAKELLVKLNTFKQDDLVSIVLGEKDTSELKRVEELTTGLEVDDLIKQGVELISKQTTVNSQNYKVTKKRHQIRKKLPNSYDENKQPDPERWLPMKDRSYYKPKKGKKKNVKETQGGSADNFTEEDLASKVRQSTPVPSAKKSKKKGGRK
jgi:signal recognition particle subunit SRP72